MEKKKIDCMIIGNNQMMFGKYVNSLKAMGDKSGAFRDVNLSYYEEHGNIFSCSDFYNKYYNNFDDYKLSFDNILSATVTYLGTFLKKNNITFEYINSFQEGKEELVSALKKNKFSTIAITTTYYVSVLPILEIVSLIKEYDDSVKIIIGGPFIYTQYKIHELQSFLYLLGQMGADFYVNSTQGEEALVNIIKSTKDEGCYIDIENIIFLKDSKYHFNKLREEKNDLSNNLIKWDLFKHENRRMAMVRTVKSCPFSCAFCSFPLHAGSYQYIDAKDVIKELDQISQLSRVNSVTFIDDTFNVPFKRYKMLLELLKAKQYKFKWNCNFRCQYADEETVDLMKESGCEAVFLGIESGSDTILKNMHKESRVNDYKRGIELLKKHNIITYASFILGFPGETEDTVRETIKFIEDTQPDFYRVQLWYYDTMTPIYKEAEKYGLVNSQFEWSHNTMSSSEAADWIDYLHKRIKSSVWLPQNDFDYPGIINLLSRGVKVEEIKEILRCFNDKVDLKLDCKNDDDSRYIDQQILLDTTFNF